MGWDARPQWEAALDEPAVHAWEIRDGKLARVRQFIDTVKFAEVVPAA